MEDRTEKRKQGQRGLGVRGKFANLPATKIAKLMGCHVSTAKRKLYQLEKPVTEDAIGNLIMQYRLERSQVSINKFFQI